MYRNIAFLNVANLSNLLERPLKHVTNPVLSYSSINFSTQVIAARKSIHDRVDDPSGEQL